MASTHVAHLNVARLLHPVGDARVARFVNAVPRVNRLASNTPGFVWRFDDGSASGVPVPLPGVDDPLVVYTLSVWQSVEHLRHFVFETGHATYLRRRADWFEPLGRRNYVLWTIAAGSLPTVDDASERLAHLDANGPSAHAFDFEWARP